jgi:lipid-binding SYLF domain-containing protein
MRSTTRVSVVLTLVAGLLISCSTAPSTPGGRDVLLQQATATLSEMNREDPGLDELTRRSYGYAIFPEVAKAGLVFGGGYGRGVVYEQGQHIGYADLSQASFGLQVGGQTYSELIVFENKAALERLKEGRIDLAADASAVILKTGAAANARFVDGFAVFVRPIGGAMAEATVSGQQVTYVPK